MSSIVKGSTVIVGVNKHSPADEIARRGRRGKVLDIKNNGSTFEVLMLATNAVETWGSYWVMSDEGAPFQSDESLSVTSLLHYETSRVYDGGGTTYMTQREEQLAARVRELEAENARLRAKYE